jgi:hypothetical protein
MRPVAQVSSTSRTSSPHSAEDVYRADDTDRPRLPASGVGDSRSR